MLLLKQDITKKEQVDKITSQLEFKSNADGEEYKVEAIKNSKIYAKESESDNLSGL